MQEEFEPLTPEEEGEIWTNVFTKIRRKEKLRKRRTVIYAAALLILLFASVWVYRAAVDPIVYKAESLAMIRLQDGTQVTLFQGAELKLDRSFPGKTRDVFLKGNALFKVAKSKTHPFIVHGNGYDTRVMGTVFKIVQNGRSFKVDLYEGKVSVARKDHHEVYILKQQQQFTNLGNPAIAVVGTTVLKPDHTTTLAFNKCRVKDAIKVIERTYGITVEYPAELRNQEITVTLPTADADLWMETLAIQFGLTIKQHNDNIYKLER